VAPSTSKIWTRSLCLQEHLPTQRLSEFHIQHSGQISILSQSFTAKGQGSIPPSTSVVVCIIQQWLSILEAREGLLLGPLGVVRIHTEGTVPAQKMHYLKAQGDVRGNEGAQNRVHRIRDAIASQPKYSLKLESLLFNTRTHTRTQAHMHTHAHTYTHTHAHTCTHAHTHTCTHAHMHTHIHTCMHTHACMHIHTHIHTYIHTQTRTPTNARSTHACVCRTQVSTAEHF